MITFEIFSVGKFKLSLSRLSKITSSAIFVLFNNRYIIQFDNGLIQNLDVRLIDTVVPDEGISFQFSTIKIQNLLKNFKGGETIIFNWDLKKKLTMKPVQKTLKKQQQKEVVCLTTQVNHIFKRKEIPDFDFDRLEQRTLPGSFSIQKLIWIMEKVSATFSNFTLSCEERNMKVSSVCDSYSCESELDFLNQSNVNSSLNLESERFLNLLWLLDFISDHGYLFSNPKTLDVCMAVCNDSDQQILLIL